MKSPCSPRTHPTQCQLVPGGPRGWAGSERAQLETPIIPSGTREAQRARSSVYGTSLPEEWTHERLGPKTARGTQGAPRPRGTVHTWQDRACLPSCMHHLRDRQMAEGTTDALSTSGRHEHKDRQRLVARFQTSQTMGERHRGSREGVKQVRGKAEGGRHSAAGTQGQRCKYLEWL